MIMLLKYEMQKNNKRITISQHKIYIAHSVALDIIDSHLNK